MIVPTSSETAAIALSRRLFQLARPADSTGDVARYFCGWLQHPQTEQWALNIPDMPLWIAPDADANRLDAIFTPWVNAGHMRAAELAALQSAIIASRGVQIVPLEFLALLPLFAAQSLTDKAAREAGWFGAEDESIPEE